MYFCVEFIKMINLLSWFCNFIWVRFPLHLGCFHTELFGPDHFSLKIRSLSGVRTYLTS